MSSTSPRSASPRSPMRPLALVGLLVALGGLTFGLYQLRRTMIRSWFVVGPAQRSVCRGARAGEATPGAAAKGRVRVLLVDGLGLAAARRLSGFSKLCRAGLELTLDVGFPSVSLPVQHALWTGTWQQRSGVQFAVRRLARPVFPTLPGELAAHGRTSTAVADAHREIVDSFGFSRVVAPAVGEAAWPSARVRARALAAAGSEAALVLVHLLGVDKAGHHHGAASAEYRAQAERADGLLAALLAGRRPGETLVALSDHGHLAGGGHGGLEPEVRRVRACLAGPGLPAGGRAGATIVDVHRLIGDRLGLAAPRCGEGRPLAAVLAGPPPAPPSVTPSLAAQLPGLACAALLLVCFALLAARGAPLTVVVGCSCWPAALAALAVVALRGPPSLSRAYVYPALPLSLWPAALVVLAGVGLQLWRWRRAGLAPGRAVAGWCCAALVPPALLVGLTGWPAVVPPLRPWLSAWASLALTLAALTTAAAGVALGLGWLVVRRRAR